MQLIAEAYDLLRHGAGLDAGEIASTFDEWNRGDLESFLIEITAKVLAKEDAATGEPLVDVDPRPGRAEGHRPLDRAGRARARRAAHRHRRGGVRALAVRAARPSARRRRERRSRGPTPGERGRSRRALVDDVRDALYASKVVAYAQGFEQMPAGVEGLRLEPRPRRPRDDLARRLHHPRALPGPDLARPTRDEPRLGQPAGRCRTSATPWPTRRTPGGAWSRGAVAARRAGARRSRPSLAYYDGYRRERGCPPNLLQGAARLLRRAHLPPRRPRGRLPHPLGPGRRGGRGGLSREGRAAPRRPAAHPRTCASDSGCSRTKSASVVGAWPVRRSTVSVTRSSSPAAIAV